MKNVKSLILPTANLEKINKLQLKHPKIDLSNPTINQRKSFTFYINSISS